MLKSRINDDGPGIKTLALSGNLDAMAAPQLEAEGASIISQGCKMLVIDCSGIGYISSSGLRAVYILAKKLLTLDGKLVICRANGLVKDALKMSGFDSFIPLKETHAEALTACSQPDDPNPSGA